MTPQEFIAVLDLLTSAALVKDENGKTKTVPAKKIIRDQRIALFQATEAFREIR